MLIPSAPGIAVAKNSIAALDYSLVSEGYVMASYRGGEDRQCQMRIECNKQQQNLTILHDKPMKAFPLCYGDGRYSVMIIRQIEAGSSRAEILLQRSIDVELRDPFLPYLYPNTYTWYDEDSQCVKIANEICAGLETDFDKYKVIYHWICDNVYYDKELAQQITTEGMSWWLPNPDKVVAEGKGICWGYSSLAAAMCRSQGIPCRMCVGHAGSSKHAWNDIWLEHGGIVNGIIYKSGDWTRSDITFMDSGGGSAAIVAYVSDDSKYTVEYYG